MGLRKINTIELTQANKVMHLSAIAYNLKKYLKFEQKLVKSAAEMLALCNRLKIACQAWKIWSESHSKSTVTFLDLKITTS